jgi:hypothetical protein
MMKGFQGTCIEEQLASFDIKARPLYLQIPYRAMLRRLINLRNLRSLFEERSSTIVNMTFAAGFAKSRGG